MTSPVTDTSTQDTPTPSTVAPSSSSSSSLPSHHKVDYYEQQILHDSTSLTHWLSDIDSISHRPIYERIDLYRRAIQHLPYSYKLWWIYFNDLLATGNQLPVTHEFHEYIHTTFQHALMNHTSSTMAKYPFIWLLYIKYLCDSRLYSEWRHAVNRALQVLPITHHLTHIWNYVIDLIQTNTAPANATPLNTSNDTDQTVNDHDIKSSSSRLATIQIPFDTSLTLYKRYLQLVPAQIERYIEWLIEHQQYTYAISELSYLITNPRYRSIEGKSKNELWSIFLTLVVEHSNEIDVNIIDIPKVIQTGIKQNPSDTAKLYNSLADYYIQRSEFDQARQLYHHAINSVVSVHDFSLIYNAYTSFLESMAEAQISAIGEDSDESTEEEINRLTDEMNQTIEKLDKLVNERPFLLSNVLIRQSPHSVDERLKRISLFEKHKSSDIHAILMEYATAIKEVDVSQATGKLHVLWCNFANFYEKHGDAENTRDVYKRAVTVVYKSVDALATVYCNYIEFEIRHNNLREAYNIVKRALIVPKWAYRHAAAPAQKRVSGSNDTSKQQQQQQSSILDTSTSASHKRLFTSVKLWQLYVDLDMHFGTPTTLKTIYNTLFDTHVITPALVLTYTHYLESHRYYEQAFRTYERAVALFPHPHSHILWQSYLHKFIERYGSSKLERCRDLFEQSIIGAKLDDTLITLYLLYANYEETYGLTRKAMQLYERACSAVSPASKLKMYLIYITRVIVRFGVARARIIYEQGLKNVSNKDVPALIMRYASMETRVGEIDRARAIYQYGGQYSDPRVHGTFWQQWHDFEIKHGNAETYKDMLRAKRNTQAQYAHITVFNLPDSGADAATRGAVRGGLISFVAGNSKLPAAADNEAAHVNLSAPATEAAATSNQTSDKRKRDDDMRNGAIEEDIENERAAASSGDLSVLERRALKRAATSTMDTSALSVELNTPSAANQNVEEKGNANAATSTNDEEIDLGS